MKNVSLLIFLFTCSFSLYSQSVVEQFKSIPVIDENTPAWAKSMYKEKASFVDVYDAYYNYYRKFPFEKTIHTQNFKFWVKNFGEYVDKDGMVNKPARKIEDKRQRYLKEKREKNRSTTTWENIGPFETYKNGTTDPISWQTNLFSVSQSESNPDVLIAGSESGGIFKTVDKALTWDLVSKDEVFSNGITAVSINPTNEDHFLLAANSRIYESLDGGISWVENYYLNGTGNEIKFDPDDDTHIYIVATNGLYETMDAGVNWTQVFSETVWDLDFKPTDANTIYLLKSNSTAKKTEFYKSTNGGSSFTLQASGWYVPEVLSEANENGGKIGVSADDPNRVYAGLIGNSKADDNGWIGIYRSDDSGSTWSLPSGQIGGPYADINTMPWNAAAYSSGYHQGYYNYDLEVSPDDADLLWFGTVRLSESSDGGTTYESIGAANSQRLNDIHADIQGIEVLGEDIWIASDGGLNYSNDNLQTHESRKYNISAADFWGFGMGWNDDVLVGGKYHNGNTAIVESYGTGLSHNVGGVEEATGYINPLENKIAYFNQYWSGGTVVKRLADNLGGSTVNLPLVPFIPNESYSRSSSSGFYFHPQYADKMYAGRDSIIWKSEDGGASWDELYPFVGKGQVYEICIARSNPDVMYAVVKDGFGYWDWVNIYKTTDAGITWEMTTELPTNNRWRYEMDVDPMDENVLYVAAINGADGQKVYKTTDGGDSWINLSTTMLDGEAVRDIISHGGETNVAYLVTANNFYYYDPTTSDWIQYSTGLPYVVNPLRIYPFYRDNKIRLCSSRGFWEVDMPIATNNPIIDIITSSDSVNCARDTISFDSYSIINHDANTTWNWQFTPTPAYVSDVNTRNPNVVFAMAGPHSAELTITNVNGTFSKLVEDIVFVSNKCEPDTIPGNAVEFYNSGDYVQTESFNINTNTFTITAWVKPIGIQPEYSGIVMNDGSSAGINFREANNTLAYHWPGGAWWYDSNLEVPSDEWSYVALVAEPNSITLYLNGVAATHSTSVDPVDITSFKFGSYQGWGSRNMTGEMDEVCLWSRSLSEQEIREWRHLTKHELSSSDPDFLAYYQFNDGSSKAYDRIGIKHGTLTGGSEKIASTASIANGYVDHLNINSAGNYIFGNTGVELEFESGATYPNGDVYASYLHFLPHNVIDNYENLEGYWIFNNYGSEDYTGLDMIRLEDPFTSPSATAINSPTILKLQSRNENEYTTWVDMCFLSDLQGEKYAFLNSDCSILNSSQLFIEQNCITDSSEGVDYSGFERVIVSNIIDANNTINAGADVIYDAGNLIDLSTLFEVKLGATFEAKIGGCGN